MTDREQMQKDLRKWLETYDASFSDAMTIIWWSFFNKKRYGILVQGYIDGLTFWAAMSRAKQ